MEAAVRVDLSNIVDISPASWAFAGLKQDGTVVVWGIQIKAAVSIVKPGSIKASR
ncbi:hypothetical protein [Vibrio taketomensis]|uniref:hypothetical protein n=1 Tax=Vibrio taketomensis TaxID=2572923 RepID=UPI0013899046|nr:hypothetical protein [Vibrio taketomensis]